MQVEREREWHVACVGPTLNTSANLTSRTCEYLTTAKLTKRTKPKLKPYKRKAVRIRNNLRRKRRNNHVEESRN